MSFGKKIWSFLKSFMVIAFAIVLLLGVVTFFYMRLPKFGKAPAGVRLETIRKSPNYRDGKFQNQILTPDLTEGSSYLDLLKMYLFERDPRRSPAAPIPSVTSDLLHLPPDREVVVWFGHSSYFLQIGGQRILVDPVFSGNASPLPGTNAAFAGSDSHTVADLPAIDYLFITHDHYDHIDYETLLELQPKVKKVVCGLGVGAHFEHWGYTPESIIEKDWNQEVVLDSNLVVYTAPARHFSGRGFTRNNTLWLSYVLQTPNLTLYLGGDSGYAPHFAELGKQFGPFDLVFLDNGQYNAMWIPVHTHPEEVLQAAKDLQAKHLFPVHSSKFLMANHPWDEPLIRVSALSKAANMPLVTPIIGEIVDLRNLDKGFAPWWETVETNHR